MNGPNYVGQHEKMDKDGDEYLTTINGLLSLLVTTETTVAEKQTWLRLIFEATTYGQLETVDINLHESLGM